MGTDRREIDVSGPLRAALGLVDLALTRLLAAFAPWSSRSLHDAWKAGYIEGVRDGSAR